MTKTFITRTISAVVAILILFAICYFLQIPGLKLICYFVVIVGGLELINILLPKNTDKFHKTLFYITLLLIFHIAANYPSLAVVAFALAVVVFLVLSLLRTQGFAELDSLVRYQTTSVLGF